MADKKKYTFSRTYVGKHGVFVAGKTYELTDEQAKALKDVVKEAK